MSKIKIGCQVSGIRFPETVEVSVHPEPVEGWSRSGHACRTTNGQSGNALL